MHLYYKCSVSVCVSVSLSVCVLDDHALTVKRVYAFFCMHTHMIPRCVIGYNVLTSMIYKGQVKKGQNNVNMGEIQKCPQGPIFLHTHS